jgi:hypothetical protein
MRPVTHALALTVATLAFSGWAHQASAQTPAVKTPAAKPAAASNRAGGRRPMSLVANGTIARFDHGSNTLTIKTSKGEEQFTLPASVRIQEASRKLTVADLDTLNGRSVNIRYTESGGQRSVQSVRVSGASKKGVK